MTTTEPKINLSNYDLKCQLNEENYAVWHIKIVNLITVLEIATITLDINNNKIITFKENFDAKATHLITTNLSEAKTMSVKFCTTAQAMWDLLNDDAQGKDQARGVNKLLDMVNFSLAGKSMKDEISKMKTLVMEVSSAMGSKEIAFDRLAMLMFAFALPASFGVQRSQILREMKTIAEMEVLVLQEEKFQRGTKSSATDFAGYTGTSDAGGKKSLKRTWPEGTILCEPHGYKKAACNRCPAVSRENQKCENCNELGHKTWYSFKCKQYRPHPDPRFLTKPPIHFVHGVRDDSLAYGAPQSKPDASGMIKTA